MVPRGIEHRCPRDRDRHPGVRERADVLRLHAAVDFDLDVLEAAPDELRLQAGHLADRTGNERLPAREQGGKGDRAGEIRPCASCSPDWYPRPCREV
jgi:hypothetical protein